MPSVRQLAKEAGVSIGTVSRVLNNANGVSEEARSRVLSAANRSGYVANVGSKSTTNIALLYTGSPSPGSPFDAAVMQGMTEGLDRAGFDLLILSASRARSRGEMLSQMLIRKGVRGAIVRTDTETRHAVDDLAKEGFPCVVLADEFPELKLPAIAADAEVACRRGLEHLIQLGHRRIGITLNLVDDHDHAARLEVWRTVLSEHGMDPEPRLIHRVPAYRDAGAVALRQIMTSKDRPTAVFCTDPLAAVGMCHEAQRSGVSIPGDLSVLGFDDGDQRFATFPRLSAVCQDAYALGRAAFAKLDMILGEQVTDPHHAQPQCWFEPHESTGPVSLTPED